MRGSRLTAGAVSLLLFVAAPTRADDWQALGKTVRDSYQAKAYGEMRAAVTRQLALAPNWFGAVYNLACTDALLGDTEGSLEALRRLTRMGIVVDAAADADLASVVKLPAYVPIREAFEANRAPVSHSRDLFRLAQNDFVAEDIAYDPKTHGFFVSSVRQESILRVSADGKRSSVLVQGDNVDAWSFFALALDARRGVLWATTGAVADSVKPVREALGRTALLRFDAVTGKRLARAELHEQGKRLLGDMTVGPNGDAYVSEAFEGGVYWMTATGNQLERLVPAGTFLSPQTPAVSADGKRLYVPDYIRGIAVVDLATRAVRWMTAPPEIALSGIDGLYRDGTNFFAVQNGIEPHRVVRLKFDPASDRITGVEPLERGGALAEPTHGTVTPAGFVYLAETGWRWTKLPPAQRATVVPTAPRIAIVPTARR